jgi:hypothetical protein
VRATLAALLLAGGIQAVALAQPYPMQNRLSGFRSSPGRMNDRVGGLEAKHEPDQTNRDAGYQTAPRQPSGSHTDPDAGHQNPLPPQ